MYVWMKNNILGFKDDNCLSDMASQTDIQFLSVKPCMLFFIQTLPRILCAGAISRVSFLELFGPIAGAMDPVRDFAFFVFEHTFYSRFALIW